MIRFVSIMVALMLFTGCASLTRPGTPLYRFGQEHKLSRAVALLERKEIAAAREQLEAICAEPGVPGVTDEALFRLSMLDLANGRNKAGTGRALKELDRIMKEYPSSPWSPTAAAITDALTTLDSNHATEDELRQQIKKLKEQVSTLNKENRELRESIEKLKNLEIELGKGLKH
jgi:hypothetical protein